MMKPFLFLFIALTPSCLLWGQDVVLSQYNLVSPISNPAYTGAHNGNRLNVIHRDQWLRIPGKFQGSMACFDKAFNRHKHGWGLSLSSFNEGELYLKTQEVTAMYAYHSNARLFEKEFSFHLGSAVDYQRRSLDFSNAVFSDQLDASLGNVYATEAQLANFAPYGALQTAFGAMVEKPIRFPIAFAKDHSDGFVRLNYAVQKLIPSQKAFSADDDFRATPVHSFSGMLMVPVFARLLSERNLQYLRPGFRYAFQGPVKNLDLSLSWVKRPFILGTSFRLNKTHPNLLTQDVKQLVFFGSYEFQPHGTRWSARIGYAYDQPLNKLTAGAGTTHELFFTFFLGSRTGRRGWGSTNECEGELYEGVPE